MAKSKTDRAASAGGSFLGGLANNPAIVIIALVLGGLFIFRDKISEGIAGLGEGLFNIELPSFPEIKFPDITFPEFNFPEFPEITFPDFTSIFTGFQEQLDNLFSNQQSILAGQTVAGQGEGQTIDIPEDTIINPDGTVSSTTPPISTGAGATVQEAAFAQARGEAFDTLFNLDVLTGQQIQEAISNIAFGDFAALNALIVSIQSLAADTQSTADPTVQPTPQPLDNMGIGFDVPAEDPLGIGGGGSFIGGTTTFGDETNIIDTLSEVLAIFPNLTASQAADALAENQGLTGNEFAQINPDIINISSAGIDPEQIINNASGGFSGLTPQQIAFILTGGNIQNF